MVTEMPGNNAPIDRMWESNRAARAARTLVQFFDVGSLSNTSVKFSKLRV